MTTQQRSSGGSNTVPARAGAGQAPPRPVGAIQQTLSLTRTELVLFYRYRLALFFAVFPLAFMLMGLAQSGTEIVPGVDSGAHYIAGSLTLAPMILAILHVTNVVTARREQMVLKRFRVGGVSATALFGSVAFSVVLVALMLGAVGVALLIWRFEAVPDEPVLVLLAVVFISVAIALFSAGYTRFCRNAEGAQLMSMIPFMVFYGASGLMVPLSILPDGVATAMRLFPVAPASEIATSAYFGRDFFWGAGGSETLTGPELWVAAAPSAAVLVGWILLSMLLLRYFRWDPREGG